MFYSSLGYELIDVLTYGELDKHLHLERGSSDSSKFDAYSTDFLCDYKSAWESGYLLDMQKDKI